MIAARASQAAKTAAVLGVIAAFAVRAACLPLFMRDRRKRRAKLAYLAHRYARLCVRTLGIRILREGGHSPGGVMIVSNHLSYVDILVIASQIPSCFVTSLDMAALPGLGTICRLAGCLFVDRKRLGTLQREIGELAQALDEGLDVAVFPEATTTNGESVKPFKRALYQSAVDAGRDIQPLCLNYEAVDGRPLDIASRDRIYWYGDMTFLPHLWELASCREIRVRVTCLDRLSARDIPDARALADRSHRMIQGSFTPCLA